jgi:hypothetical protein
MIAECAARFGPAPRRFGLWDRLTYLWLVRPEWIYREPIDDLETLFLNRWKLWRNGTVVWGHIVQANNQLFTPGKSDNPAEVVYSLADPDIGLEELSDIASGLYAMKGTTPSDPAHRAIADHLTNEYTRVFGLPVPADISRRRQCLVSTTYVVRKHLPPPGRCLRGTLLPLVVLPTPPHVALPLPSRYWPKSLVEWWTR